MTMAKLPLSRPPSRLARSVALALLSLVCSGMVLAASGDIYTFTDSDGVVHLSNVPQDQRYKILLRAPAASARGAANLGRKTAAIDRQEQLRWSGLINRTARALNVDVALLHAVVAVESGYNARVISPKGAIGLMQLMPATARRYGANPFDPEQNVRAGAQYLRDLQARFQNDMQLVLAAYNAGEEAVSRYNNTIPPYRETLSYVPKVMRHYVHNQQQPVAE